MKKIIVLSVLVLVFSTFGISDPVPGFCPSGTGTNLQDYINLGATGCTVGSLLFSDFAFPSPSSVGALLPAAANIGVTPVGGSGLIFDAALIAGPGQSADVTIDYVVRVTAGGLIEGSSLSIDAAASGNGLVAVNETQCLGGMLPGCSGGTSIGLSGSATQLTDSEAFTGVPMIDVSKDIMVSDSSTGQASISSEEQGFSTATVVPEPASLALFGMGLLGVAFFVRRKIKAISVN